MGRLVMGRLVFVLNRVERMVAGQPTAGRFVAAVSQTLQGSGGLRLECSGDSIARSPATAPPKRRTEKWRAEKRRTEKRRAGVVAQSRLDGVAAWTDRFPGALAAAAMRSTGFTA